MVKLQPLSLKNKKGDTESVSQTAFNLEPPKQSQAFVLSNLIVHALFLSHINW